MGAKKILYLQKSPLVPKSETLLTMHTCTKIILPMVTGEKFLVRPKVPNLEHIPQIGMNGMFNSEWTNKYYLDSFLLTLKKVRNVLKYNTYKNRFYQIALQYFPHFYFVTYIKKNLPKLHRNVYLETKHLLDVPKLMLQYKYRLPS